MNDDRNGSADLLAMRLRMAELVGGVSKQFVDLAAADLHRGIDGALRSVVDALGFQRGIVAAFSKDRATFRITHRQAVGPFSQVYELDTSIPTRSLPWMTQRLLERSHVIVTSSLDLPEDAPIEQEVFAASGAPWAAFFPLIVGGEVFGAVTFLGLSAWQTKHEACLESIAQVFSSALDRMRTEEERAQSHRLALLVSEISRGFIDLPAAQIGNGVDSALRRIAEVYGFLRAVIYELSPDSTAFTITHRYLAPGVEGVFPIGVPMSTERYAYSMARLATEKVVILSPDTLPDSAHAERSEILDTDPRHVLLFPLAVGGTTLGAVTFEAKEVPVPAVVDALGVLGELFASAIDRERADLALRERLRFEEALSEISARLVGDSVSPLDSMIRDALGAVGKALEFDRVSLFELSSDRRFFNLANEWCADGIASFRQSLTGVPIDEFGFPMTELREGRSTVFTPSDLPPEADLARRVITRDGTRLFASVPLVVAGEVIGCIVFHGIRTVRRITEHQLRRLRLVGELVADAMARGSAETSLRLSEARFVKVVASALDGFIMVSDGGALLEWTPQTERILGWPRGEMVGGLLSDILVSAGSGAKISLKELSEQSSRTPGSRVELACRHRDGREVPVELSLSSVEGPGSVAYAVFIRDITDRKRTEQARQRAFEEVTRLKVEIEGERDYLREEVRGRDLGEFVGRSKSLDSVIDLIENVASTSATVLVRGESGVGKELVARAIHARSSRASGPLVKVNCASIPKELFESEFFGHVRGAFTGAHRDRTGRFELANRGTLFLDEIGEIPLVLQSKLLRVLQEGELERVGDDRTRKVDVRIVAATNRDLEAEVAKGTFRNDLFYRLSVFPIEVPPLRRRPEDIAPLADHFLRIHSRELGRTGLKIEESHRKLLESYEWPGNVRELAHVIERAVILSAMPPLRLEAALHPSVAAGGNTAAGRLLTEAELRGLERENLVSALERAGWRISGAGGAAEMLGINASTLRDRMRSFDIKKPTPPEASGARV